MVSKQTAKRLQNTLQKASKNNPKAYQEGATTMEANIKKQIIKMLFFLIGVSAPACAGIQLSPIFSFHLESKNMFCKGAGEGPGGGAAESRNINIIDDRTKNVT